MTPHDAMDGKRAALQGGGEEDTLGMEPHAEARRGGERSEEC